MKTKHTFLLALTFLFLFCGSSVVFADDFENGMDAHTKKDYKEAIKWFRLSAKQGLAKAQLKLGVMYHNGQGVPQDYKESIKWLRLSADQGNAKAQSSLGWMYDNGEGVGQDYKEAVKWYRLSADQGDAGAQNQQKKY
jgi:hypothetical protein|tara:strand:- start:20 stop:433 length:414 start_codon:yes stop_codon:yes gene_type:complete